MGVQLFLTRSAEIHVFMCTISFFFSTHLLRRVADMLPCSRVEVGECLFVRMQMRGKTLVFVVECNVSGCSSLMKPPLV